MTNFGALPARELRRRREFATAVDEDGTFFPSSLSSRNGIKQLQEIIARFLRPIANHFRSFESWRCRSRSSNDHVVSFFSIAVSPLVVSDLIIPPPPSDLPHPPPVVSWLRARRTSPAASFRPEDLRAGRTGATCPAGVTHLMTLNKKKDLQKVGYPLLCVMESFFLRKKSW